MTTKSPRPLQKGDTVAYRPPHVTGSKPGQYTVTAVYPNTSRAEAVDLAGNPSPGDRGDRYYSVPVGHCTLLTPAPLPPGAPGPDSANPDIRLGARVRVDPEATGHVPGYDLRGEFTVDAIYTSARVAGRMDADLRNSMGQVAVRAVPVAALRPVVPPPACSVKVGDRVLPRKGSDTARSIITHTVVCVVQTLAIHEGVWTATVQPVDTRYPQVGRIPVADLEPAPPVETLTQQLSSAPAEFPAPPAPAAPEAGVKFDGDKPRMELLLPTAMVEMAKVLGFGARKYPTTDNWKRVPGARRRYSGAMLRHAFAYLRGETFDPETGYHHMAAVMACAQYLIAFDLDNIPEVPEASK